MKKQKRILLVEDNPGDVELVTEALCSNHDCYMICIEAFWIEAVAYPKLN